MTKRKRLSQEDKVLSYVKDRRNTYGENDKGSRKAIRFRTRCVNGTYRSQVHDALGSAGRDPDEIADGLTPSNGGNGETCPTPRSVRRRPQDP